MGFFTQAGSYTQPTFSLADAGVYECELISVDVTERKSFDSEQMESVFRWVFETTEVGDENGNPFKFSHFTKTRYGADQAKLTILLDQMLGKRLDQSEFNNLELADLKSKKWAVEVGVTTNAKGYDNNVIMSVKPVRLQKRIQQ